MPQRIITTLLNKARKEGWLEGREAGRRAALVQDAGMSHREAAAKLGITERQVRSAITKVNRRLEEAGVAGLPDVEAEAWKILRGNGLASIGEIETRIRQVHRGEVESADVLNLHRLAGIVGVDVARVLSTTD